MQTFRCSICWTNRRVVDRGSHIGTAPRLPVCRGCGEAVKSGIPAEIHMMTLGLSEPAAIARASILRSFLCAPSKPKQVSPAIVCYEILQRAVWRLESELSQHRCMAEECSGDLDAVEQIAVEIERTRWLLGAAEVMLQAAEGKLGG